jgi:hypothetical protein
MTRGQEDRAAPARAHAKEIELLASRHMPLECLTIVPRRLNAPWTRRKGITGRTLILTANVDSH